MQAHLTHRQPGTLRHSGARPQGDEKKAQAKAAQKAGKHKRLLLLHKTPWVESFMTDVVSALPLPAKNAGRTVFS
ncbi:hypothetical protein GCM10023213_44860 [Prosthecobacter algae]|uniref:Uncharacterized protein n=1 Tax=Prosthecobacter algae TaxID=1144682 RepID=A0ABP9PLC7_9BACT